jgi:hypothetical protein
MDSYGRAGGEHFTSHVEFKAAASATEPDAFQEAFGRNIEDYVYGLGGFDSGKGVMNIFRQQRAIDGSGELGHRLATDSRGTGLDDVLLDRD